MEPSDIPGNADLDRPAITRTDITINISKIIIIIKRR